MWYKYKTIHKSDQWCTIWKLRYFPGDSQLWRAGWHNSWIRDTLRCTFYRSCRWRVTCSASSSCASLRTPKRSHYLYHRNRSFRRLCFHRCLSVHGEGFLCPGGVSVQGVSLSRGSLSRGVSVRETPVRLCAGRYASYWKTFLFSIDLFSLPYSIIFKCD